MKPVEFKSTVVAGLIGAAILVIIDLVAGHVTQQPTTSSRVWAGAGLGFVVGAGVQIGVRLTGVS